MEIKNLYTLKTILEEGSFANAANRLSYTQSTITFQMRQLEEELGVTLFEKIGRKMVFTQDGKRMLPYINDTIEAFEKLQNIGRDLKDIKGTISIILSESILCYKMEKVISEFHELAPHVELKLKTMSCYDTKQAIVDGNADLGICYDEQEEDERLSIHSLGHVNLILVASQRVTELMGLEQLDFEQQNSQINTSFITDEPDGIFRKQFEKYVKAKGIILNSTIELWNIETIKSLVRSGMGVTFLPDFTVKEELRKNIFVTLPHNIPCDKTRAIYVYHKNKYLGKPLQLMIDLLEKYTRLDTAD